MRLWLWLAKRFNKPLRRRIHDLEWEVANANAQKNAIKERVRQIGASAWNGGKMVKKMPLTPSNRTEIIHLFFDVKVMADCVIEDRPFPGG